MRNEPRRSRGARYRVLSSYQPGVEAASAHQVSARLDASVLVLLSADLTQLEGAAYILVKVVLLLFGTGMRSRHREGKVSHEFLTSNRIQPEVNSPAEFEGFAHLKRNEQSLVFTVVIKITN